MSDLDSPQVQLTLFHSLSKKNQILTGHGVYRNGNIWNRHVLKHVSKTIKDSHIC